MVVIIITVTVNDTSTLVHNNSSGEYSKKRCRAGSARVVASQLGDSLGWRSDSIPGGKAPGEL